MMSRSTRWLVCTLLLALMAMPAFAQSNVAGGITGTVKDQTGAVVPNVSVTAVSNETNAQLTATTDAAGGFRISPLTPGTYTVTVSAAGFSPFKATNIIVEVGRPTPVEVSLTVGATEAKIEVVAEAPVINTAQGDLSTNINQTSMSELPIATRRWSAFAASTPGASGDGFFGLIAFRGISGLLNNNTVDGGDNNNAYFSEERGRTRATSVIGQDSIREYQVNASNFSAEYGRAAGAVVNAVTKSGTNSFHGSGFLFATDSAMWAKNFFSKQSTLVNGTLVQSVIKPADRLWQFGGNIGGPIKKDKLFFFFNWDQQKENAPGIAAPDPRFFTPITVSKPGNCNAFSASATTTSQINTGGISNSFPDRVLWCRGVPGAGSTLSPGANPLAAPASPGITQAQTDAGMAYLVGLGGLVTRNKDQHVFFPKVDWRITDRNTFTGSWNRMRWNSIHGIQTAAINNRGVASWGDDFVNVDTVNARLTSLVTSTFTNEFRFSWGLEDQFENSNPPGPGEPTTGKGGRPPAATINRPALSAGSWIIGKPNFLERPHLPQERRYQFTDIMSKAHGNHFVKWGLDINRSHDLIDNLFQEGGDYSYTNIEDFITDFSKPSGLCGSGGNVPCYSSFTQGIGPTAFQFSTTDFSGFVQDDWHVARRVTLNLGARYEYEKLPKPIFPNTNLAQTLITPKDTTDFGPRIGGAFDIFGDGKTVLRGGYGMFYGRIINAYVGPELTVTGAPNSQVSTGSLFPCVAGATGCFAPLYPQVLASVNPNIAGVSCTAGSSNCLAPAVDVWGGNVHAPRIHEFDAILERQIARNTVVSVSYLGSIGRRLPFVLDRNLPTAPTGSIPFTVSGGPSDGQVYVFPLYSKATTANNGRPNPAFDKLSALEYIGVSRYDGLVFSFNRRMTDGLQVQGSYTHARATDMNQHRGTGPSGSDALDPNNLALESGTSSFDIRHRFNVSAIYQPKVTSWGPVAAALINGFSIAPIWSISSGAPLTFGVSGNAATATSYLVAICAAPPCASGTVPSTISVPAAFRSISTGILGAGGSNRLPNLPRNSFLAPGTAFANLRVARKFRVAEGKEAELIAEVFNLTNHMNYTSTSTTLYSLATSASCPVSARTSVAACSAATTLTGTLTYPLDPVTHLPTVGTNNGGNDQARVGFTPRQFQFGARFRF